MWPDDSYLFFKNLLKSSVNLLVKMKRWKKKQVKLLFFSTVCFWIFRLYKWKRKYFLFPLGRKSLLGLTNLQDSCFKLLTLVCYSLSNVLVFFSPQLKYWHVACLHRCFFLYFDIKKADSFLPSLLYDYSSISRPFQAWNHCLRDGSDPK